MILINFLLSLPLSLSRYLAPLKLRRRSIKLSNVKIFTRMDVASRLIRANHQRKKKKKIARRCEENVYFFFLENYLRAYTRALNNREDARFIVTSTALLDIRLRPILCIILSLISLIYTITTVRRVTKCTRNCRNFIFLSADFSYAHRIYSVQVEDFAFSQRK